MIPNLRVVELWSLPELDPVRFVFSFVILFLVQIEGFSSSGLWEWRMCGYFLRGAWPASVNECLPWVSA